MLKPNPSHRLDPLMAPASLALVGASSRPHSPGHDMVRMAVDCGFSGTVYPINPKYADIDGIACFASLSDLPEPPDHVAIALGDTHLEGALKAAIEAGAKAATIFASGVDNADDGLPGRLKAMALEAGIEMCGINCMGFYNLDAGLRVCAYASDLDMTPGGIAFIAQSGSVFAALANNDRRTRFNMCVSSGAETVTTTADYLEYALAQPSTKVATLFVESIRKPDVFEAALADAAARDIPVVVLKVGRTEASAAMALTHTGALAGNDGAYEALFRQYGVIRVNTIDEMAAVTLMLQHGLRAKPGDLATMHDSGGEREMIADLADDLGVRFAQLTPATVETLAANLDPGLKPENPLDAWGIASNQTKHFPVCLKTLARDPNVGVTGFFVNIRDGYYVARNNVDAALEAGKAGEAVFLATNYAGVRHRMVAQELTDAGVPVIDGTEEALRAVRHLFAYRDFQNRTHNSPVPADAVLVAKWRERLNSGGPLDEADALDLLEAFGVATPARARVDTKADLLSAAEVIGYPVVLKTAMPEIRHKSDVGGVVINIKSQDELSAAYGDMASRLGPRVLVSAMAGKGVEIALGAVLDPQFGACVMISAGGTLIELLDDKVFARAPVAAGDVPALLNGMKIKRLLGGLRGDAPADVEALGRTVERFSVMIASLGDLLDEADVNPLIVSGDGAIAVDALIEAKSAESA